MHNVRRRREIAAELREVQQSLNRLDKLLSPGLRVFNKAVESTHSMDYEPVTAV